jgi:type II secretory pathway pseudopilin PulG
VKATGLEHRHAGYTYLALMILVALIGILAASAVQVGALLQRRAAEEELLFVGGEFQRALASFANATPVGHSRHPRGLDDLLRDPRFPGVRRHLRRVYVDPVTGLANWALVPSADGGIGGVHSASALEPIKQQGFGVDEERLAHKAHYSEWIFGTVEAGPPVPGAVPLR